MIPIDGSADVFTDMLRENDQSLAEGEVSPRQHSARAIRIWKEIARCPARVGERVRKELGE